MRVICLTPITDGVYNAYCTNCITKPPEGWAYIPDSFPLPSTFPRLGSIETEEVNGVMIVTGMTEGSLPEPVPEPEPTKTTEERISELETSKANQSDVDELAEALDLLLSGVTE